jgi:Ca2+-binding RTX toxin-like protein
MRRFGLTALFAALFAALFVLSVSPASGVVGCTITGTPGNDSLYGTNGDESICGLGGNDTLIARGGNDFLDGGDDNDVLLPGKGDDTMNGGAGIDAAAYDDAGTSGVFVDLNRGMAVGLGAGTDRFVFSGPSLDTVENVYGSAGDDSITGDLQNNYLLGRPGNDSVSGGPGGNDVVAGSAGDDTLDVMDGSSGDFAAGGDGLDGCRIDPGDASSSCP